MSRSLLGQKLAKKASVHSMNVIHSTCSLHSATLPVTAAIKNLIMKTLTCFFSTVYLEQFFKRRSLNNANSQNDVISNLKFMLSYLLNMLREGSNHYRELVHYINCLSSPVCKALAVVVLLSRKFCIDYAALF